MWHVQESRCRQVPCLPKIFSNYRAAVKGTRKRSRKALLRGLCNWRANNGLTRLQIKVLLTHTHTRTHLLTQTHTHTLSCTFIHLPTSFSLRHTHTVTHMSISHTPLFLTGTLAFSPHTISLSHRHTYLIQEHTHIYTKSTAWGCNLNYISFLPSSQRQSLTQTESVSTLKWDFLGNLECLWGSWEEAWKRSSSAQTQLALLQWNAL